MPQNPNTGLDLDTHFMWKTDTSINGNCPALYRTEHNGEAGYVVQGKLLSAATLAQLRNLGDDELGLFVPADVIDKIKDEG